MAEVEHADYPHHPGTLYDCPACESECFCDGNWVCIYCAALGAGWLNDTLSEQFD